MKQLKPPVTIKAYFVCGDCGMPDFYTNDKCGGCGGDDWRVPKRGASISYRRIGKGETSPL